MKFSEDTNYEMDLRGGFDNMEPRLHVNVSGMAAVYASSSVCHLYYGNTRFLSLHLMFAIYETNEVKQPREHEGFQLL